MSGGRAAGILIVCALAFAGIFMKLHNQSATGDDMYEEVISAMETMPDYWKYQAVYMNALDAHHEVCFDRYYDIGGRRTAASFDEDKYWMDLLAEMADDIERDGYKDCAGNVRHLLEMYLGS